MRCGLCGWCRSKRWRAGVEWMPPSERLHPHTQLGHTDPLARSLAHLERSPHNTHGARRAKAGHGANGCPGASLDRPRAKQKRRVMTGPSPKKGPQVTTSDHK